MYEEEEKSGPQTGGSIRQLYRDVYSGEVIDDTENR